ncbi:MAG: hypothetical protein JWR34_2431 [Mycobacterium sp.]|nr:hypothetical protein [Mycobacterium sp.]
MAKRLVLAAGLLLVAACGSVQAAPDQSPPGWTIATTEPAPTSRNIVTEGVIDKRVGQPGGLGCGEGPDAICDVVFTVTALEQDPKCPGVSAPAGMRLLRIAIDAEAAAAFQFEQPPTALLLTHWDVETDDGARHPLGWSTPVVRMPECSPNRWPLVLIPATAWWSRRRSVPPSSGCSISRRHGGGRCVRRCEAHSLTGSSSIFQFASLTESPSTWTPPACRACSSGRRSR